MAKRSKSTPKRTIKRITEKQYVVYRSVRTGKITKYRRDRRLIAEVRNKKSNKVVGYLNKFEGKRKKRKVVPRKITRIEKSIRTGKQRSGYIPETQNSFTIYFNERVLPQIVSNGRRAIDNLIERIEVDGDIWWQVDIQTSRKGEVIRSREIYEDSTDYHYLATRIGIEIINQMRSLTIRTSLKKHVEEKSIAYNRKGRQWAYITLRYASR